MTFALKWIDIQRDDFKRLGVFLGDWDHPYVTLHHDFEAEQIPWTMPLTLL